MVLRIVETSMGPILVDDENDAQRGAPTRLELLANETGITSEELRASLRDQIQDRRREVGAAWESLDRTLDNRVAR